MDSEHFSSSRRGIVIYGIFLAGFALLGYRLYHLQFVEYDAFREHAARNSLRRIAREPMRGLIYDREMKVVVDNNPSYTLTVTPFEFSWSSLPLLSRLFALDSNLVRYRISKSTRNAFEPVKIARDITFEQLALLEENRAALPGVSYLVESRREYKMQARMAHLIGYTKEISQKLLEKKGPYYQPGDIVGYSGLEAYYEDVLRGVKGYGYYTVDSRGKVVESFENGRSDEAATEGSDIVLSLDMKLQDYAERLLRGRRGSIVALDPSNGEILAFASSPDYDLKDLSGRISSDLWRNLNEDEGHPLYNRCSMAAYPPGSTFKMLLAVAALQEGIIDEKTTIPCPGSYTLAGVTFKCHGAHGNISVIPAIEYSCNVFFYKLIFKLGFDAWSRYGAMFHFGRKTGMDIASESPGVLPSEAYYNRRYGKRWNKGYLVSLGIGQGEVNTTPLQMAAYTATIANGGTYFRPHVVRAIIDRTAGGKKMVPVPREKLPIADHVWSTVRYGMFRAVNGNGTGYAARIGGAQAAGKTGTAQNPHGRDHAWFVGFAPYKNPKVAVAVIIENGGWGGDAAAPVAGSIMRYALFGPGAGTAGGDSLRVATPDERRPKVVPHLAD
ncbi:MAG: penicillin-binding protein 2 [Ignavibacteriae bacterium]|nr:penicillin-binding protein 2 [Ignavibacteriota bacterium]